MELKTNSQTGICVELTKAYVLALYKENPAVIVTSHLKETAYRVFLKLLGMGATEYQIKSTIDWAFNDTFWKSRLGDPRTFEYRWNDLSSKALSSQKEKQARFDKPTKTLEPILLSDYWAIEHLEMTKDEAVKIAATAKALLEFYGPLGSGLRWQAIIAVANDQDPKPFIESFAEFKEVSGWQK